MDESEVTAHKYITGIMTTICIFEYLLQNLTEQLVKYQVKFDDYGIAQKRGLISL